MKPSTLAEVILFLLFAVILQLGAVACTYWAMNKLARLTP